MSTTSSQTPTTGRKALAHLAGIVVYIVLAGLGMIAYGFFYKVTGPKVDGMVGGAIIVFLPVAMLTFGLAVWTPAWILLKRKWQQVTPMLAFGFATGLSLLSTILYCQGGLGCFMPGRSEHMVGWFFVILTAIGAAAHSALYRRITRSRGNT